MRFPAPLRPGDRIGVTAPSSGVDVQGRPRFEFALEWLRRRGFEVVVGECLDGEQVRSAPADRRAAELVELLCDPTVAAVVPPFGGELAIDLLEVLDWDRLAAAEPTWLVGWSDISTLLVPMTTRLGWATLHGWNLMDTPLAPPEGLLHWTDVLAATGEVVQRSPGRTRVGWGDFRVPDTTEMALDVDTDWVVLGGGDVDVSGRLIGGCLEVLSPLAGTPYADVPAFGRAHADDGLLVYLEAAEQGAYDVCRILHGLRLSGWFDHANAVLVGRTPAPDAPDLTQLEAVEEALGGLGVPVIAQMDIGHTQPFMPLVNGALARVVADGDTRRIAQTLA
ncbi:LD-carboxypeptidase [Nocardioides sp. MAH-18]|uniref:LD-carboxypeptidase n=1 Tax=Nocardioides agri TaxID=2682843 RepID=A0A6L6XMM2_9ACTN|nr:MULTISPECIES: S66 peptidase family protein [unclassified Nocardioides]MBA2953635.1 LD-carboxypeptidase [Nocardioides sp. CGMCC 1.13656]MVQ48499.1 LD-carboxypeptidase [Nocardioides sp. MAH-18]